MNLKDVVAREPVMLIEAIRMVIMLAIAFGISISTEQLGAILAAVSAVAALVTRGIVTSPAEAQRLLMTPPPETKP